MHRLLNKFATWSLSKNKPGPYCGEDDKRWAYVIETNGDRYLTRIMFPRVLGVRVFLHHFHRPDGDRNLHNHPWTWAASAILCGSYDEERLVAPELDGNLATDVRRVRWFNWLTDQDYHAVKKLHGDVWTLFVTGPRVQDWGFLTDKGHVSWREYLKR